MTFRFHTSASIYAEYPVNIGRIVFAPAISTSEAEERDENGEHKKCHTVFFFAHLIPPFRTK
jgi:hypothetical protein